MAEKEILLSVENLSVTFYTSRGTVQAVRDASFEVRRGEVLGIVGESGCGKSTSAFSIMGYLPSTAEVKGSILFEGTEIGDLSEEELRKLRGNRISMVYQDPTTSLNPSMKIGKQVSEVIIEHTDLDKNNANHKVIELFESVGLADPDQIGERYPHELSGGMQQRIMIAMALACDPDLLIMDEPTTGLDVTTEATILDLISNLKDRVNAGIVYVSHNLGVIARVADRVSVMYAGQTVEQSSVHTLFESPKHPYTAGLLSCVPKPPSESGEITRLNRIPGFVFSSQETKAPYCLFLDRCPLSTDQCMSNEPQLEEIDGASEIRCFNYDQTSSDTWGSPELRKEKPETTELPVFTADGLSHEYGKSQKQFVLFERTQKIICHKKGALY